MVRMTFRWCRKKVPFLTQTTSEVPAGWTTRLPRGRLIWAACIIQSGRPERRHRAWDTSTLTRQPRNPARHSHLQTATRGHCTVTWSTIWGIGYAHASLSTHRVVSAAPAPLGGTQRWRPPMVVLLHWLAWTRPSLRESQRQTVTSVLGLLG